MSDDPLHIDLETRSTVELRKTGVYPYARHPETDIWVACYAFGDGPIGAWVPGEPVPEAIRDHVADGGRILAWNTQFERILWRYVLHARYGWPQPVLEQWDDPMVWALSMALPAALEQCAQALRLPISKDLEGRRLMLQMAKPRRVDPDGRVVWWDQPEKRQRLLEYCRQDVVVEREICNHLLPLSPDERLNWLMDQRINDRGVKLDLKFVRAAQGIVDRRMEKLDLQMRKVTQGKVPATSQVAQLGQWLRQVGYPMESVDKDHIKEALADPDCPDLVKGALKLRRLAAKTSTAKLVAMEEAAGDDTRARGCFQFHKASPGRWSSTLIQLHNLPRGDAKKYPMDQVVREILMGSDDWIEVTYGDPLDVVSAALRGALVAGHGNVLVCCDYSQIEARINAFLAGQDDVIKVFASGEDVYVHTAAAIGSDNRTLGKVIRLACGFGMGAKKFKDTAEDYGLFLTQEEAKGYVDAYREADAKIKQFWYDLEGAAVEAIRRPGRAVKLKQCDVTYRTGGKHLWCRLPSGRTICYPFASLKDIETPWGTTKPTIHYWGIDTYTKRWVEQRSYGGHLCENVVQGLASDVLRSAMRRLEAERIAVVAHVHDEVICEVPAADLALQRRAVELVEEVPPYLVGCPIAADTLITPRYRKK